MTTLTGKPVAHTSDYPPAIEMLLDDHHKIEKLFEHYADQNAEETGAKADIARRICVELALHAALKEEFFYPKASALLADEALITAAKIHNGVAQDLITRIMESSCVDASFDALVKDLGESVARHAEEEETKLFPKLIGFKTELADVAQAMVDRRAELQGMAARKPTGGAFNPLAAPARPGVIH
jgi:hemerythrin superfamily protein